MNKLMKETTKQKLPTKWKLKPKSFLPSIESTYKSTQCSKSKFSSKPLLTERVLSQGLTLCIPRAPTVFLSSKASKKTAHPSHMPTKSLLGTNIVNAMPNAGKKSSNFLQLVISECFVFSP